jgi:hypothetical protein
MHGNAGDYQFCFLIRGFGIEVEVEMQGLATSLIGSVVELLTGDAILRRCQVAHQAEKTQSAR